MAISLFLFLLIAIIAATSMAVPAKRRPHIVHILVDDLGWAEVGYHNTVAKSLGDVKTPNLDLLSQTGLELDRFYTEKICSPSRSSLQSGRLGIHVNVQNVFPEISNPSDPVGGYQGIPINMTGMAEVLQRNGYKTHVVGKWDVGMATNLHSPKARGFDTWLGYWHHSNDYWNQEESSCYNEPVRDLWRQNATFDGPAIDHQNNPFCSQENQTDSNDSPCVYEDDIFFSEVTSIIESHKSVSPIDPLFLFYSFHLVHMPLEAKKEILDQFSHVDNPFRQKMHAMVSTLDTYVGGVVDSLKKAGLWEDTLLVVHGDNGGEIITRFCGGNNYPLRGGKFSQFEGGIRSPAIVSGGFLPLNRRGVKVNSLMHISDWYSTYAKLAGESDDSLVDKKAENASLPPIDSSDCWPMLSGLVSSCRTEVIIGETSAIGENMDGDTLVGAIIRQSDYYKILLGPYNQKFLVGQDVITGPIWPNISVTIPILHPKECGRTPETGCLYNVLSDPGESINLALSNSDIFYEMLSRADEIQKSVYSPVRGTRNGQACKKAAENGNYWGPFV